MMKFAMLLVLYIVCESMQIIDASSPSSQKLNAHYACGSFSHPDETEKNHIIIALRKSVCTGPTGPPCLKDSEVISK